MLWILAIILPPLAILLCGKPFQALINIILTLLGWIPASSTPCWSSPITTPTSAPSASSGPSSGRPRRCCAPSSANYAASSTVSAGPSTRRRTRVRACPS